MPNSRHVTRHARHAPLSVCSGSGQTAPHETMCYTAQHCPLCDALARVRELQVGQGRRCEACRKKDA